MTPESLKCFRPLVKRTNRLGVRSIEHAPPIPPHVNEPPLQQDPQMLRDRRLHHPQRIHNLPHRPLLQREIAQNRPPPRLCHRIKRIRSCRRSCHAPTLHSHMGICQAIFFLGFDSRSQGSELSIGGSHFAVKSATRLLHITPLITFSLRQRFAAPPIFALPSQ